MGARAEARGGRGRDREMEEVTWRSSRRGDVLMWRLGDDYHTVMGTLRGGG